MSSAVRMHEYILTSGVVPDSVVQLVELEQQVGDRFVFNPKFDASIARTWLGLSGNASPKLPDAEHLRLANLLRRAGKISDEELASLGMYAKAAPTLLERIHGLDGS